MPQLRIASFRQMKAVLESIGYTEQPRTGASHVKFKNATGQSVVVPGHGKLQRGLISAILRQTGMSRDEYHNRMRNL